MEGTIRLTKHHGSGNDFLVLLAVGEHMKLEPEEIAALCDRRRGFGADGLIVGRLLGGEDGGAAGRSGDDRVDLQMDLTNADGSFAEMSGNGIRCLVQAAVAAGVVEPGTVNVDTAGGLRHVEFKDFGSGLGFAEVDMGPARVTGLPVDRPPVSLAGGGAVTMACEVNVGNPHVVLLAGERPIDLQTVGPIMEHAVEGGANIEVVASGPSVDGGAARIDIDVWERGVGITESCGTGACAAAAAARSWDIAADAVDVRSGGGILRVRFTDSSVMLAGPARMVGEVMVDLDVLRGLVAERSGDVVSVL